MKFGKLALALALAGSALVSQGVAADTSTTDSAVNTISSPRIQAGQQGLSTLPLTIMTMCVRIATQTYTDPVRRAAALATCGGAT